MRMFLWEDTEAKGAPQQHHGRGYGPWALRRDDGHPGRHPGSCAVFREGGARLEGKASGQGGKDGGRPSSVQDFGSSLPA